MLTAARYIAQLKSVCGIGVLDHLWYATACYASFHHAVPLYWATVEYPIDPNAAAFNTVVYDYGKPAGSRMSRAPVSARVASSPSGKGIVRRFDDGHVQPTAPAGPLGAAMKY